jgi:phosphotransferase system IIA component
MAAIEAAPSSAPVAGAKALTQQHALIRNADEYADLFAHAAAATVTLTATADTNTTEQGGQA